MIQCGSHVNRGSPGLLTDSPARSYKKAQGSFLKENQSPVTKTRKEIVPTKATDVNCVSYKTSVKSLNLPELPFSPSVKET